MISRANLGVNIIAQESIITGTSIIIILLRVWHGMDGDLTNLILMEIFVESQLQYGRYVNSIETAILGIAIIINIYIMHMRGEQRS